MSGFLNLLRSKRSAPPAVTLKFRLRYKSGSGDIHAFFESTDDIVFYIGDLKRVAASDANIHTYICDGKAGVYHALRFGESTGRLHNVVFFVDKDLDDIVGESMVVHPRLFRTAFYSIENYVATDEAFKVIWEEQIQLPTTGEAFKKAVSGLRLSSRQLYTKLRPLTAWVIERRRENCAVNLANLNSGLHHCFALTDFTLTAKHGFEDAFKSHCGHAIDSSKRSAVRQIEREIRKLAPKTWVRGKFDLWWFVRYTDAVWASLVGMPISKRKKVKKTLNLSRDIIFSLVASKVRRPEGLSEFLSANLSGAI